MARWTPELENSIRHYAAYEERALKRDNEMSGAGGGPLISGRQAFENALQSAAEDQRASAPYLQAICAELALPFKFMDIGNMRAIAAFAEANGSDAGKALETVADKRQEIKDKNDSMKPPPSSRSKNIKKFDKN